MTLKTWASLFLALPISNVLAQTPPEAVHVAPTEAIGPTFHFGDFDGDGLEDIYVVAPLGSDQLFRNLGAGAFEDVTIAHGLSGNQDSRTALWMDFDGDKALDLYISKADGRSRLVQNTGQGLFVDVTAASAIEHSGAEFFARVVDFDADAAPDLLVVTELGDILWHNLGRGRFERAHLPSLVHSNGSFDVAQGTDASAGITDEAIAESGDSNSLRGARRTRSARALGMAVASPSVGNANNGGGPLSLITCRPDIQDALSGLCLGASATPTLGLLYPLSTTFNVSSGNNVGIGTITPGTKLDVVGSVRASSQVVSTIPTGTAPLSVASTTKVTNLNADTLDGIDSSGFSQLGTSIESSEITNGTIQMIDLGQNGAASGSVIKWNGSAWAAGVDIGSQWSNNGATVFYNSGAVGVGTSAPEGTMHVFAGSAGTVMADGGSILTLEDDFRGYLSILTPDGDERGVLFGEPSNNAAGAVMYNNVSTPDGLQFRTNGNVTRVSISAAGNLGIGTTAPSSKLEILDTAQTPVAVTSSNTAGTWSNLTNTSTGGDTWNVVSTGSGNTAGAGKLVLRDADTNTVAMTLQPDGRVGIGTSSPREKLEVREPDATLRVQNSNDYAGDLGGFVGDSWNTLQLGMVNSTAGQIGAIPANTKRSVLGIDSNGAVGSLTNTLGSPTFRNLLDDGSGGARFAGSYGTVYVSGTTDAVYINSEPTAFSGLNVIGTSSTTAGQVLGQNFSTTGGGYGIAGRHDSPAGYGVFSVGAFGGTGAKYFVQPHPTDASKEIRFICLEGNEAGTYFRGKTHLSGGKATIEVPEDFRLVTESEGLTVQLTAVGRGDVWVESYDLQRVRIAGERDFEVHYVVNGVRRGYSDMPTMRENAAYVPNVRGVPYGTQYPKAVRDLLVANGTLNADYTPNESTALQLGWKLVEPYTEAARSYGWGPERRSEVESDPATHDVANH